MNHRVRAIIGSLVALLLAAGGYAAWRSPGVQEARLARQDLTSLSELVAVNPTNWRAQYWYGRRLAEAGELEQAEQALRISLGNDPGYLPGYTELGKVLLAQNRVEEAFQLLRMATGRDPENNDARLALAVLYRTQGAYDRAEREAAAVLSREPDNLDALYERAASQALMQQYTNAEKTMRHAYRKAPGDVRILLGLSRVLQLQGALSESEQLARKALSAQPANSDCLVQLAKVLSAKEAQADALAEALRLLQQAREVDGGRTDVVWLTGKVLMAQGKWEQAVPELVRVTRGSPDATQAFFLLAQAYRRLGQPQQAARAEAQFKARDTYDRRVAALTERIGVNPDNPALRFQMAELHIGMGQSDLAIAALRAGLQREPENETARRKLAKLVEAASQR